MNSFSHGEFISKNMDDDGGCLTKLQMIWFGALKATVIANSSVSQLFNIISSEMHCNLGIQKIIECNWVKIITASMEFVGQTIYQEFISPIVANYASHNAFVEDWCDVNIRKVASQEILFDIAIQL